jgi:hypothetical protein
MFVPLTKADAVHRLVYGFIDETPDNAGEVMDYATAKPAFQKWSDARSAASGGKSLGNIRAQHDMKKAAGVLKELSFDDENKRIGFVGHIVDAEEWAKVEAGVYTGFSPGGSYAKSWPDGRYRRYTPNVMELSIVDVPCIPTGTFTFTKADGTEVEVPFAIAETTGADAEALVDPLAALDAAFAKADAAVGESAAERGLTLLAVYANAADGVLRKSADDRGFSIPTPAAIELLGADVVASVAAFRVVEASAMAGQALAKGLYTAVELGRVLETFAYIVRDVIYEAQYEGDAASPLPQMGVDALNAMKALLVAMIQEETAELLAVASANCADIVLSVDGEMEGSVLELATKLVDLVKSDEALMEKAGARNSRNDAAKIQGIHDNAAALGATCGAEKVDGLSAENERLTKAVAGVIPRVETLTKAVSTLTGERDKLAADLAAVTAERDALAEKPALTKRDVAFTQAKEDETIAPIGNDTAPLEKADAITTAAAIEDPTTRQHALERIAISAKFRTQ